MKITLCGSTKFKEQFEKANQELTLGGNIVYSVAAFGHADAKNWTEEQKTTLDLVHFAKIEESDVIYVIDVDNYIGFSTAREIQWAKMRGKKIFYLSETPPYKLDAVI